MRGGALHTSSIAVGHLHEEGGYPGYVNYAGGGIPYREKAEEHQKTIKGWGGYTRFW